MAYLLKRFCFKKKTTVHENERIYTEEGYDKTYKTVMMVLKVVFLKVVIKLSESRTRLWAFVFSIIWVIAIVVTISETLAAITIAMNATSFYEDAPKVLKTIPCFGFCWLALFKGLGMKYNRKIIENLYFELRELWPRGEVSDEEHRIIKISMSQLHRLCTGYFLCNNAMLTHFIIPLEIRVIARFFGYDTPREYSFECWMPFDEFQPGTYEVVLQIESLTAFAVVWWNTAWDILFCSFVAHITMHLDLLANSVRRLIYVPVDQQMPDSYPLATMSKEFLQDESEVLNSYSDHNWEVRHATQLTNIVKRHRKLVRLAADVENLFSLGLLINFLNGSLIICFSGACLVLFEKWNEWAYKAGFAAAIIETWMLSYYGQKLLDSSLGVGEALYQCGWYKGSQKIKSSILIMLQRCQNAIHVTTYGFAIISLDSYSAILKTSWSYFTIIMNFYHDIGQKVE